MKGTLKITEEKIKIAAVIKALLNYSHYPSGSPPPAVPAADINSTPAPTVGLARVVGDDAKIAQASAGDAKSASASVSPALLEV